MSYRSSRPSVTLSSPRRLPQTTLRMQNIWRFVKCNEVNFNKPAGLMKERKDVPYRSEPGKFMSAFDPSPEGAAGSRPNP